MIQEILKSALEELDSIKKSVPSDVYDASFDAALDGIEKGFADYKKDLILQKIKGKIEEKMKKIQSLSPADMKKLIQLTQEQFDALRTMDQNARKEFLSKQPSSLD